MSAVASAAEAPRESRGPFAPVLLGLYGLLSLGLVAYFVLLVVEPAARESLLLNGWGAATFEIVVSVLVLLRGLTTKRDSTVAVAFGTGMLMWALGDVVLTLESRGGVTPASPSAADLFYLAFFARSSSWCGGRHLAWCRRSGWTARLPASE
jgi:hypothetical protein